MCQQTEAQARVQRFEDSVKTTMLQQQAKEQNEQERLKRKTTKRQKRLKVLQRQRQSSDRRDPKVEERKGLSSDKTRSPKRRPNAPQN